MGITTPTAVMIIDQLVHRATFPSVDANFTVEWQKTLSDPVTDDISSPLPFRERITKLEGGVEGASTREIPRYIEMLKFMLDRMKWKIEEFERLPGKSGVPADVHQALGQV